MIFTERLFRTFASITFFTALAGSSLTYTFAAMVRSTILPSHHSMNTSTPTFLSHVHRRSRANFAESQQSSPILGICFCLIIVRLGRIFPVAQEEIWHTCIRAPPSRSRRPDRVSVSFPPVEIRRGTYVNDVKDFPMEPLGSQK